MILVRRIPFLVVFCLFSAIQMISAAEEKGVMVSQDMMSPQTRTCIGCHSNVTPGIVQDWLSSRHAKTLPGEALKKSSLEKRISAETLPKELLEHVVGCYECHSRNVDNHKDAFDHMGHRLQVVVSPHDCKTCHPVEAGQFSGSKKSYAYRDLMENPVYVTLVDTITGLKRFQSGQILSEKPSDATLHETCLGCHGTIVSVKGWGILKSLILPSGRIRAWDG
jgi:hydroxylamine dehydrogenase